jgi:hypothetical protein
MTRWTLSVVLAVFYLSADCVYEVERTGVLSAGASTLKDQSRLIGPNIYDDNRPRYRKLVKIQDRLAQGDCNGKLNCDAR